MAGPDPRLIPGKPTRGRVKARRRKAAHAPSRTRALLNVLNHTLWFLPNVASCYAMANLLEQRQNAFYNDYTVNVCAGTEAGIGVRAVEPVRRSMGDPLSTKTITPLLRQADHRCDHQAVDRHFYAAQSVQPGDLFPRQHSVCRAPGRSPTTSGKKQNHQKRVLCL